MDANAGGGSSVGREQGDFLAAMPAVNFEIRVQGPDEAISGQFTHSNEIGICKRHGDIGIAVYQPEHAVAMFLHGKLKPES
jgi:hypothetical protein